MITRRPPGHHRPPRSARLVRSVALLTVLVLAVATAGCGVTRDSEDGEARRLRLFIPNSPGGGYDLTGRAAAKILQDDEITGRFEIRNVLGASGTVAMQRLLNEKGADDLVMVMGLGVVGAVYTNSSKATPRRMTPIARLVEEQEGILVPGDSPFRTVEDLVAAWRKDPRSVTVGGGSSPGGPDHLFPMQLADTVGVDPNDVSYISYDGGGPLTAALLGEKIDVGMSGLGEFEQQIAAGSLRVLAVSGDERLPGIDAPTLTEAGVDLVFTNWRGVLAPPDITDEQRDYLIEVFTTMHDTPEWRKALEVNGWSDNFATGKEFADFLAEQDARVADTLKELGLA